MKIDRVILSSDNNPLYYNFWNPLSKVYKTKFGITPTLIWIGTKAEATKAKISTEYGDVKYVAKNKNYPVPFQTTWALFWATQFYKKDVCWIMGIDQVPLSRLFIDKVKDLADDDYAMLISDAYRPQNWEKTASPSSYHVAKGSTFLKVHKFHKTFSTEIKKVVDSGVKAFWEDTAGRWGMDESYSCHMLREARDTVNIVGFKCFDELVERRIECERHKETPYNLNKLRQGWYSESHMCRPFTNHSAYLNNLFNDIPDCK